MQDASGTREERDRRLREIGVDPEQIVDDRDAEYMLKAGADQPAVVCTLTTYRYPDTLKPGDPLPPVVLHPLAEGDTVRLDRLAGSRPLVLIFGSYT